MPKQRRKRRYLGCSANGVVRRRPERMNHVWSYDFVSDRTEDGRRVKILTIIDEYTRECPAMGVARSITSSRVIKVLGELMLIRGVPEHMRLSRLGHLPLQRGGPA